MNIYRQNILDHFKNPQNYGQLRKYDYIGAEFNALCGDKIVMYLNVENDIIKNVKFTGSGCAVSMASVSMLTEKIKGMSVKDVLKLDKKDIMEMLGVEVNAGRLKCALLGLECLKKIIK